jgi:hypothetical protein
MINLYSHYFIIIAFIELSIYRKYGVTKISPKIIGVWVNPKLPPLLTGVLSSNFGRDNFYPYLKSILIFSVPPRFPKKVALLGHGWFPYISFPIHHSATASVV